MSSQRCLKFTILQICVSFALIAAVNSAPNWPTPEFFERHYHNIAPASSELTISPSSGPNIKTGNSNSGTTASTVAPTTKDQALRSASKRHFQYAALKMAPQFPQYDPFSMYRPYMRPQPFQMMFDEPMLALMDSDMLGDAYSQHNIVALLHPRGRSFGPWGFNHETKSTKPRWSTRRRLSAREAVAVMEEELQRREAAKYGTINPVADIQTAASNTDSVAAAANRRSGHHMGITGPVHTFVKTDKHGHYKWGVRHHAGHGFS